MRTQTTENQIIQLLTERDESALSIIEREYDSLCLKISLDILSNQQDAEECCNDALLRVWHSIPPTRPVSLRAYLVTIRGIAEKCGFSFGAEIKPRAENECKSEYKFRSERRCSCFLQKNMI